MANNIQKFIKRLHEHKVSYFTNNVNLKKVQEMYKTVQNAVKNTQNHLTNVSMKKKVCLLYHSMIQITY